MGGTTFTPGSTATLEGIGTVIINSDGSYTFVPVNNYKGTVPVVTYTVTDGITTASASLTITILSEGEKVSTRIKVPQGISPNGDGVNDYLKIEGIEEFPNNRLEIFNRWGNKVFEAQYYQNNWDGKNYFGLSLGNELPVGTYFYVLDLGDGSSIIKGYIYLVRK